MPNKTKSGERDEALALLNHLQPLLDLRRALMSALDTEFKSSKNPLRVLILNLLRAGQFQSRCSAVSNSSSPRHTLQSSGWDLLQILVSDIISQCPVLKPIINFKLALSKNSSQHVFVLSQAGHRHLEIQQPDAFPQLLCAPPLINPVMRP